MSSTGVVAKERSVDFGRSTLLLIGSFAIAWNTTTAVHELGHLIADRSYGLDAGIVLEPFRASYTSIANSSLTHSAWLDAAGPLSNLIVGVLVIGAVWRVARPAVFPLLLWGPLALLQESTNALVQMATVEPGTDWMRVVEAGFPTRLIWFAGVLALIGGFALLIGVVPAAGVSSDWTLSRRVGVLGVGFGAYRGPPYWSRSWRATSPKMSLVTSGCWRSSCWLQSLRLWSAGEVGRRSATLMSPCRWWREHWRSLVHWL